MCFMQTKGVSKELSSAQPKPGVFSCPEQHLQVPPAVDKGLLVLSETDRDFFTR